MSTTFLNCTLKPTAGVPTLPRPPLAATKAGASLPQIPSRPPTKTGITHLPAWIRSFALVYPVGTYRITPTSA